METPVGRPLRSNSGMLLFTVVVSATIVGCDLALVATGQAKADLRYAFAAVAVVFFGALAFVVHDGTAFGFRFTPIQGWVYWIRMTAWLGLIMGTILSVFAVIVFGILRCPLPESGHYVTHESQVLPLFVGMCVTAPLLEEAIYRLTLCPPVSVVLGPKAAIATSGIVFAGLHVLYGNPSPDNMIAGFILGWAFVKSGTIMVPIVLHSLGNLCVLAYYTAYFYLR